MKNILNVICCLLYVNVFAAEVRWDCFALNGSYEAGTVGCYYYDIGYSSPEVGLRYEYDASGAVKLDGKGSANVGWNVSIWVEAFAGDVLDRSYFSQSHIVLKDSYNGYVPYPIDIDSKGDIMNVQENDRFYLALIGNYYNDNNMPCDYYGWVEMENTGSEIVILSSAFSYGSIIVGGGAAPEPSSALLLLLGLSALSLRRQSPHP